METNIGLSEYIKNARNYYNMSQRELARRTNIDNAMISRIENGEIRKPSYEILKKISRELELNLVELLTVARYTTRELRELGLVTGFKGIKGTDRLEDYVTEYNGRVQIDLIAVFEGYKHGYLELEEMFGLFMAGTGIDLTQYIPEEELQKHSLQNMIEEFENDD